MCLSPRVEKPNSEVKKLINVRTWTTVSSPVNVLCISLYLNLYMCRWIEISLRLWYDYGYDCENTTILQSSRSASTLWELPLNDLKANSLLATLSLTDLLDLICLLTFKWFWPSQLGLQNTPTASLQRSKTTPHECPEYQIKQSDS